MSKKKAKEQEAKDLPKFLEDEGAQFVEDFRRDYSQITNKFPWVTIEDFVAHYSTALSEYLSNTYPATRSKTHIVDLSAPAASFAEAWWAIMGNMNYKD